MPATISTLLDDTRIESRRLELPRPRPVLLSAAALLLVVGAATLAGSAPLGLLLLAAGAAFLLAHNAARTPSELVLDRFLEASDHAPRVRVTARGVLLEVPVGWSGVLDEGGREVPLEQLLASGRSPYRSVMTRSLELPSGAVATLRLGPRLRVVVACEHGAPRLRSRWCSADGRFALYGGISLAAHLVGAGMVVATPPAPRAPTAVKPEPSPPWKVSRPARVSPSRPRRSFLVWLRLQPWFLSDPRVALAALAPGSIEELQALAPLDAIRRCYGVNARGACPTALVRLPAGNVAEPEVGLLGWRRQVEVLGWGEDLAGCLSHEASRWRFVPAPGSGRGDLTLVLSCHVEPTLGWRDVP